MKTVVKFYPRSMTHHFKIPTSGESMDAEAMIAMCLYKDVNGEERPVLMFFKHGLEEEKC